MLPKRRRWRAKVREIPLGRIGTPADGGLTAHVSHKGIADATREA